MITTNVISRSTNGLRKETGNGILWLVLERTRKRNALDYGLLKEIREAVSTPPRDVRGIVVTSALKKTFCAGGDVDWMARARRSELGTIWDTLYAVQHCRVPVIARVEGAAVGGGAGLVAACDIAYTAGPHAKMAFREARLGLVPAMVAPFAAARCAGRRAELSRLFVTGASVDGRRAADLGLTNAHFETAQEMDRAIASTCNDLRQCSPQAVEKSKQVLARLFDSAVLGGRRPAAVRNELANVLAAARSSSDGKEGVLAFKQKRKPKWALHF